MAWRHGPWASYGPRFRVLRLAWPSIDDMERADNALLLRELERRLPLTNMMLEGLLNTIKAVTNVVAYVP